MKKTILTIVATLALISCQAKTPTDDNVWPDQIRMEQMAEYQGEDEYTRRIIEDVLKIVVRFKGQRTIVFNHVNTGSSYRVNYQKNIAIEVFNKNGYELVDIKSDGTMVFHKLDSTL